jgi:4-hydroxy-4-methyl-2-oxoglutarate aldolase
VFARGLCPNSPYKDGPGEIGLPVAIGGVTVNAGDLVVGDQDGVVVVVREALAGVADALAKVRAKEAKMDELVRGGTTAPPWMARTLAEKGVRFVD